MQAYKVETKISESGTIFLPRLTPNLFGREVELFIILKEEYPKKTTTNAKSFVSRWAGFLKDKIIDPEETKFKYLTEKYQ